MFRWILDFYTPSSVFHFILMVFPDFSSFFLSFVTFLQVKIIEANISLTFHRRIVYSDLANIAPENYIKKITARITDIKAVETPADRSAFIALLESAYRFTLGAAAGGEFDDFFFSILDLNLTFSQLSEPLLFIQLIW
jgi:hypothetical protein